MRSIILIALFAYGSCTLYRANPMTELLKAGENERAFESIINETLECVRNVLKEGRPLWDLPSLNPLLLDGDIDLDILGFKNLSGKVTLKNFVINGITDWETTHLKGTVTILPPGAKFEITMGWPTGDLLGDYSGDILVFGENLQGAGTMKGSLVKLGIDISLHGTLGRIGLKNFSIRPSLEDITFEIDGLNINGEDASASLSESISNAEVWVTENAELIDKTLSEIIMDIVNNSEGGTGVPGLISQILEECLNV